jgi:hypothetical protein
VWAMVLGRGVERWGDRVIIIKGGGRDAVIVFLEPCW